MVVTVLEDMRPILVDLIRVRENAAPEEAQYIFRPCHISAVQLGLLANDYIKRVYR
jgi:hypothetical protein